jgi:co-chaperonin GroES (HSP10)
MKAKLRGSHVDPAQHVSADRSDGGWHGSSVGSVRFDTEWQPLADRLLVKRIGAPARSSVIVLPDSAQQDRSTNLGIILRCGPGKRIAGEGNKRQALSVKPGDVIVFGPYTDWDSFGQDVVLIQEADIRVVVNATHNSKAQAAAQ